MFFSSNGLRFRINSCPFPVTKYKYPKIIAVIGQNEPTRKRPETLSSGNVNIFSSQFFTLRHTRLHPSEFAETKEKTTINQNQRTQNEPSY